MTTVSLCIRKTKRIDGACALAIRITQDRKSSYIFIGVAIQKAFWDAKNRRVKKSHPNSVRLNNLLLKKLAEVNDTFLALETKGPRVSAKTIKKKALPSGSISSFFVQADKHLDNLKTAGKYGRHRTEGTRVKIFRKFTGSDIPFSGVTVALLEDFRAYLLGKRKVKERTVANYLITIRTIYNQAVQSGLADRNAYPFGKGKIVIKFPDSLKIGLTAAEVKRLEEAELEGYANHARNVWLLSYYFAGVRMSDVLQFKWSDFKNGRLYYTMSKNLKGGSLKVPAKAGAILDQYREDEKKHDLIFPELKVLDTLDGYEVGRKLGNASKNLRKALRKIARGLGIDKKISMHISRHSFAQVAADKIPLQILQKLYRHASITTTIGYQSNFTTKDEDEALEKVLESSST